MSIQHALVVLLDSVFSAYLHAWAITLEITSGMMIALLVAVLLYKGLANWRDKAVHRALDAEFEYRLEAQIRADIAEGEKRYQLQTALHSVWDEVNSLEYALHGTSQQIEDDLWEISQISGTSKPSLVLPECYRPFHVELAAIDRGLTHLGSQIDSARAENEDLNFYKKWVEELWARFRLFELKNNTDQRRVLSYLSEIRDMHTSIGKLYCLSAISPAYQHFPGMIHVVETMSDDNRIAAKEMFPYVAGLYKQLTILMTSFEQGKF
ncbi:MAG: hypothetical protein H0U76_18650 [Ktedonobacteraceae bacterium]|nr:hypothetical protein [Ktedonobacteraceae bacterium]